MPRGPGDTLADVDERSILGLVGAGRLIEAQQSTCGQHRRQLRHVTGLAGHDDVALCIDEVRSTSERDDRVEIRAQRPGVRSDPTAEHSTPARCLERDRDGNDGRGRRGRCHDAGHSDIALERGRDVDVSIGEGFADQLRASRPDHEQPSLIVEQPSHRELEPEDHLLEVRLGHVGRREQASGLRTLAVGEISDVSGDERRGEVGARLEAPDRARSGWPPCRG